MTTKNLLSGLVISGLLAGVTQGAVFRYNSSGDWSAISNNGSGSTGWGLNPNNSGALGSLPGVDDEARINWGGNTVTVTTAVPTVRKVMIGVDESGIVQVDAGGVLSSGQDILAGNNNVNATGTLTVNNGGIVNVGRILWSANNDSTGVINLNTGGVVNVESHLWWGVTGLATVSISGTLTQNGGNLGLGTSNASDPSGGSAIVTVSDGGLLSLNSWSATTSIQDGSVLNINGSGTVTVGGDRRGEADDYFALGKIASDSGGIMSSYDGDSDRTTIVGIPEPGSAALLGLAGFAAFARRRRSQA